MAGKADLTETLVLTGTAVATAAICEGVNHWAKTASPSSTTATKGASSAIAASFATNPYLMGLIAVGIGLVFIFADILSNIPFSLQLGIGILAGGAADAVIALMQQYGY